MEPQELQRKEGGVDVKESEEVGSGEVQKIVKDEGGQSGQPDMNQQNLQNLEKEIVNKQQVLPILQVELVVEMSQANQQNNVENQVIKKTEDAQSQKMHIQMLETVEQTEQPLKAVQMQVQAEILEQPILIQPQQSQTQLRAQLPTRQQMQSQQPHHHQPGQLLKEQSSQMKQQIFPDQFYLPTQEQLKAMQLQSLQDVQFIEDDEEPIKQTQNKSESKQTNTSKFNCSLCTLKGRVRPADYVNLGDFKNKRFLCSSCLTPEDKMVLPLNTETLQPPQITNFMRKITINKNHSQASNLHKRISTMFESQVHRKLRSFIDMQNECIRRIKRDMATQLLAITNTFNGRIIQTFIQKLKSDDLSPQQKDQFDILVLAMKYSGSRDFSFTDQLLEAAQICFKELGGLIQKEMKELKGRFQNLDKNFMKYRVGRVYEDKRNAIVNFVKGREGQRVRFSNTAQQPITIDIQEEDSTNVNKGHFMPQPVGGMRNVRPGGVMAPVPTSIMKQSQKIQSNKIVQPKVTFNLAPSKPYNHNQPKIHHRPQIQRPKPRPKPQQLPTIQVTFQNCEQIWLTDQKTNQSIKRIVVNYQRAEERALKCMANYRNTQELIIFDYKLATKAMVPFYFDILSSLKKIELNCYNDFDAQHLSKLTAIIDKERLQTLFYGPNYCGNLSKIDEKRSFPQDNKQERQLAFDNEITEGMLGQFPNLQNIWIDRPTVNLVSKVRERGNIRYLILGRHDNESENQKLDREVWEILSRTTGLLSLTLNKIQLQSQPLQQIFIRNKQTLQTIYLHDCRKLKDHTLTIMRQNLSNLKELNLFRCGQQDLKGDDIWQMINLQTLVLRQCQRMDLQRAQQNIRNLVNLRHINLMGCIWISDDLVAKIAGLPLLTSHNYANTNITNHAVAHLKVANNLRALNIGSTKIKGSFITDLVIQLKLIRKLSLKGLGAHDNVSGRGTINSKQMQQIGVRLQYLTHLDISGCQHLDDSIFQFLGRNLKFLGLWMASGVSKGKRGDLSRKGINIIDDIYGQ